MPDTRLTVTVLPWPVDAAAAVPWQVAGALFVSLWLCGPGFADSPDPAPGQVSEPVRFSSESKEAKSPPPEEIIRTQSPGSSEQRLLSEAVDVASRLRRQSRTAFGRGLMPLADYADQLALALQLETTGIDLRGDGTELDGIRVAHAAQLEDASRALRRLNQPAARGWAADLAYAQFLAAQAGEAAAASRHGPAARQRVMQLAERHYRLRYADLEIGLASLRDLARAGSQLTVVNAAAVDDPKSTDSSIASLTGYRETLTRILHKTERLTRSGAGVGRIDRVHEARFELGRVSTLLAGLSNDEHAALESFRLADSSAQKLFEAQLGFHVSGTASVFDIARGWFRWQELNHLAARFEIETPETSNARQQNDLQRLTELADRQTDHRGRYAADVTMVHGLRTLQDIRSLATSIDNATSRQHD